MVEGSALWFGAAGFEVLGVAEVGAELVVEVETTRAVIGCSTCGTRAVPVTSTSNATQLVIGSSGSASR